MAQANAGDTTRRVLMIVPPYMVTPPRDATKKAVRSFLAFPYGALTIASYIKSVCQRLGEITVLDLNLYPDDERAAVLNQFLTRMRPHIVGISIAYDVSYKHLRPISKQVKEFDPSTLVVIGGPAATVSWDEILPDQEYIDGLCYGEGEVAMRNLIDADDMKAALKTDPWVTPGQTRMPDWQFVDSLDNVIHVDYELVDIEQYSMKEAFSPFASYKDNRKARQFFIVTSRGCPFKCVFCAEPSFHGKGMRFVSIDEVIKHVRFLVEKYGMNVLTIYDDQLLIDRARAKEMFSRLAEFDLRIEMPNGVTVAYIDDELAGLMKQAGVHSISLAIESGSEHVLRNIIKKPLKVDKVRPVVDALHANDIFVQAFFINGFPGEKAEDRALTMQMIGEWGIDWSLFNYATPLRGSELYRNCKENGWIEEKYLKIGDVDMTSFIIRAPGLDPAEIELETYRMNLDANFVNNYRMRMGDYKIAALCFGAVLERHPRQPFAHYFLAKAYEKLENHEGAADHMAQFNAIVSEDATWKWHATHFGLEIQ